MSKTVTYVAIIERIPGKEFFAHFPDFPEVRARDATIEDITSRSSEVLREHVGRLLQADAGVPRPLSVDAVKEDERYRNGFLLKVDVEVPESRLYAPGRVSDAS